MNSLTTKYIYIYTRYLILKFGINKKKLAANVIIIVVYCFRYDLFPTMSESNL